CPDAHAAPTPNASQSGHSSECTLDTATNAATSAPAAAGYDQRGLSSVALTRFVFLPGVTSARDFTRRASRKPQRLRANRFDRRLSRRGGYARATGGFVAASDSPPASYM